MRPLIVLCVLLAATAAEARLLVVNATGFNLPELEVQAALALSRLEERAAPVDLELTVELVQVDDPRERNAQPFPFGPRYVHPRGLVDGFGTVRVEATLEVLMPGARSGAFRRRFIGRAAAHQDREPALSENRARRPFAGFLAVPGRLDPLGPLVVGALENGVRSSGVDRWVDVLLGAP